MRKVLKIKYETEVHSDVDENLIYAFRYKESLNVLARKNDVFYWNPLKAVNQVWYKEYQTIEAAIEGITKINEIEDLKTFEIMEFENEQSFLKWALQLSIGF